MATGEEHSSQGCVGSCSNCLPIETASEPAASRDGGVDAISRARIDARRDACDRALYPHAVTEPPLEGAALSAPGRLGWVRSKTQQTGVLSICFSPNPSPPRRRQSSALHGTTREIVR
jgi:hypothetical protein